MATYSMTGYAHARANWPTPSSPAVIHFDLRSVNARFLDLSFKMPDELRAHEMSLRERVSQRLKRGKVEIRIQLEQADTQHRPQAPESLLQELAQLQEKIQGQLPQARSLSVADVLRLCESQQSSSAIELEFLLNLADLACEDLLAARAREGARLVALLQERLLGLRRLATQAKPLIPQLVEQQRQRFLDRWQDAMKTAGTGLENAQDRALAEATAFALRIDVAEELGRLNAHVEEIERLLQNGGETEGMGKRLDFLIQELHREANTLGAKSAVLEMTRISVDMKVLIEQMREQVQNIE